MLRVEVRPGMFLRINEKDVKKFGVENVQPEATKKATPAAAKKTGKKKTEKQEEVEDDGVRNDN